MAADNFRHSCQAVSAIVHRRLLCWLSVWLSKLKRVLAATRCGLQSLLQSNCFPTSLFNSKGEMFMLPICRPVRKICSSPHKFGRRLNSTTMRIAVIFLFMLAISFVPVVQARLNTTGFTLREWGAVDLRSGLGHLLDRGRQAHETGGAEPQAIGVSRLRLVWSPTGDRAPSASL